MLDNEQDWIEKYRAALVQPLPSRRLRFAAALNSLAKTLGFAIGKTSGMLGNPVESTVASSQSPELEVQTHPRTQGHSREQDTKKAPPPEHQQDKKAS